MPFTVALICMVLPGLVPLLIIILAKNLNISLGRRLDLPPSGVVLMAFFEFISLLLLLVAVELMLIKRTAFGDFLKRISRK